MVILAGPGTIRWGVADLDDDWQKHTYGDAYEDGGLEIEVNVGDVFVIPAGVSHKSFDPYRPNPGFRCLTGGARKIESDNPREMVMNLSLSGFTMMGAYPKGFSWTWGEGGDDLGQFETVWGLRNPEMDPVVGAQGGIHKFWQRSSDSDKSEMI